MGPQVNVALMGVLVLAMLGMQFWIRTYFYARAFRPNGGRSPLEVFAPVEGRVVYVRTVEGNDVYSDKGERQVKTPLTLPMPYVQVGTFVGPYHNHHVLAPTDIPARALHRVDVMDAMNLVIVSLATRVRGFGQWWERNIDGFLSHNQRAVFSWTPQGQAHPFYLVIIMDRYINRFYAAPSRPDWDDGGGYRCGDVLGFIGRGSQVDLFLPAPCLEQPLEASLVGRHVDPNVALARLRALAAAETVDA
jgi:hypothetical protein